MELLKKYWQKLPLEWRKEATSFSHTFFATFLMAALLQLQSGEIPYTQDALIALGTAALRSAWKAAINELIKK